MRITCANCMVTTDVSELAADELPCPCCGTALPTLPPVQAPRSAIAPMPSASNNSAILVAAAVIGVLAAGGLLAVVAFFAMPAIARQLRPSAADEGQKWNHAELRTYLVKRGVTFDAYPSQFGFLQGPAQWWITPQASDIDRLAAAVDDRSMFGNDFAAFVQIRATVQEARDQAGAVPGSFAWGRFLFAGSRAFIDRIRAVLDR